MKIFEFKFTTGEQDYVFAPDKKEAKEFYLNYTGCGSLRDYEVKEIPESEWSDYSIIDTNEVPDEEEIELNEGDYLNGYKIIESFADYSARNTQTDMIATTEY
jgi:hypothetical protein